MVGRQMTTAGPLALSEPGKPPEQEIVDVAFEFWRARGFRGGPPVEDLIRAWLAVSERRASLGRRRLFLVRGIHSVA